jgi:hypothetical protein
MNMNDIEKSKSHILIEIIEYLPKVGYSFGTRIESCKSKRAFQNDFDDCKKRV